MLLRYRYEMQLEFSQPVTDQYYSIMCVPRETARQSVLESNVSTDPESAVSIDAGGSGNISAYGVIHEPHSSFCLISEGTVSTNDSPHEEYTDPGDIGLARYVVQSHYTSPGKSLRELYADWLSDAPSDEYGRVLSCCAYVHKVLAYEPGATDVATTAEQAAYGRKGVCQDFAHVMIAMLRMAGIPARYVCGMMPGEGETHAWVEACCRGYWYGLDPTNNVLAGGTYVKFSHGRDYSECMISRGIFTNPRAVQTTLATASVEQIQQ